MTANFEDIYELTPMQQGMLFHSLYTPESQVYHVQLGFDLAGALDPQLFARAWQALVQRHAVLRTALVWEDLERPYQVVQQALDWAPQVEDWRDVPPAVQPQRLAAFLEEQRRRPFDLHHPPLMRVHLLRLGDAAWRFVWSFHHVILEGWSAAVLHQELGVIYNALRRGAEPDLPQRRPYREYIAWLQKQDLPAAEAFWREQLAGVSGPTRLAIDAARETQRAQVVRSAVFEAPLDGPLARTLRERARAARVTLHTLFQAAWALLLSRYSGEERVVFGTVVSGRPAELPGAEHMVGLFINTLPACVAVPSDQPFSAWLADLQKQQARLRQFEYSPLAQVQRWAGIPAGHNLIETLLVYENWLGDFSDHNWLDGIQFTGRSYSSGSDHPLAVVVAAGERIVLSYHYDEERFVRADIERLHGHQRTILEHAAADLERPVASIPLLTDPERAQVLDWGRAPAVYPRESTIHALFAARAAQHPDAVALECADEQVTYGELNRRANRLARLLQSLGVGPEVMVGMCLERGVDAIVAMLAILKAGGAYVPLDPEYPRRRLEYMLQDTRTDVLLTVEHLAGLFPEFGGHVVRLDGDAARIADQSDTDVCGAARADSLAYVMYTSGSTGQPKGACIVHRGVVRLVLGANYVKLGPGEVLLHSAPLSFDACTFEIWGALLNGARLVIAPPGLRGGSELAELVRRSRITVLWVTTALFHQLVEHHVDVLAAVPQIITGGEVISVAHVRRLFEAPGPRRLMNAYGPTENTTYSSGFHMTGETPIPSPVPIGGPISNTTLYVVDRHLQLLPVGVPGELCTGGEGVARGYLNQPALSAARFVPDPYTGDPQARMYRSGDRVRWLPDGSLDFLGRFDHQIKLRGFRVELGEIEVALGQHPAVRDVVVTMREDQPGDKRLVAYVQPRDAALAASSLREFLRERVPDYMIPAAYVLLDSFPLGPTGKVDRRALPAPEARRQVAAEYVAPTSPTEQAIAAIWSDLLGIAEIGVNDSFFDLGGNSLLLVQVHGKLKAAFGRDVPLLELFRYPTVAALARFYEQGAQEWTGLARVQARARRQLEALTEPDPV